MDSVTLAFLGDAFFELMVRRSLAEQGRVLAADKLHFAAVHYVNASAQAKAMRAIIAENILLSEESEIVRKARNRKPKTIPKHTAPIDYKHASAFEALLGYHYIEGRLMRAEELSELEMRIIDDEA